MLHVSLWAPTPLAMVPEPPMAGVVAGTSLVPKPSPSVVVTSRPPLPAALVTTLPRILVAPAGTDLVALRGRLGAGIAPPARARFPAGGDATRGCEGADPTLLSCGLPTPCGADAARAPSSGALVLDPLQVDKWAEPCLLHTQRLHSLQAIKPVLALHRQPSSRQ